MILSLLLSAPARAANDLGVVLFDPWPSDLPTPSDGGVPIRWAVPGSPAALGGIKSGDVILSIDMFTVSTKDLARRWQDKTTGAAGCIPMDVLRTNLQPKGWKHVPVCIPVKSWTMPSDATANAAAQVPLVTISGTVEHPGTWLIGKKDLGQLLAAAGPNPVPSEIACFLPYGPSPIPNDDCLAPGDPAWKKLPKNRSYTVTAYDHAPEVASLLGTNKSAAATVPPKGDDAATKAASAPAPTRPGGP